MLYFVICWATCSGYEQKSVLKQLECINIVAFDFFYKEKDSYYSNDEKSDEETPGP